QQLGRRRGQEHAVPGALEVPISRRILRFLQSRELLSTGAHGQRRGARIRLDQLGVTTTRDAVWHEAGILVVSCWVGQRYGICALVSELGSLCALVTGV